ncbi:MAG TPA: putative Ig domain-containing protein [Planctomycetota bacterium]|nr:putative Ig domain-containing protein [Planctomycetota bacterium]
MPFQNQKTSLKRLFKQTLAFCILSLGIFFQSGTAAGTPADPSFTDTLVVADAAKLGNVPSTVNNGITCMAWAPDGSNRLYVTIKARANATAVIQVIRNGVIQSVPFYTFSNVESSNSCGLQSLVFHPDYASGTRQLFCYVTVSTSEQRILRLTETVDANGNYVASGAPVTVIKNIPSSGLVHNGGGLAIGPDHNGNGRYLYWACGNLSASVELGERLDNSTLASKIGRSNLDGSIPSDGFNASGYIWAYGYTSPFTMAVQPSTGKLWVNAVGVQYDQIFLPTPGSWAGDNDFENGANPNDNTLASRQITPIVKYRPSGTDTRTLSSSSRTNNVSTFTTTARHGFRKGEKITISGVSPASFNGTVYVLSTPSDTTFTAAQSGANGNGSGGSAATQNLGNCITGGAFCTGTAWPAAYQGNFFFGDYGSGRIVRVQLNADNSVKQVDTFLTGGGRITDVTFGPDGNLYYGVIDTGTIRKVVYNALTITNSSPLPATTVGAPYSQTLAVSGGSAPYSWSLASGALPAGLTLNAGTGVLSGTPSAGGTFSFSVKVIDGAGLTGQKDFVLTVNATPSITTSTLPAGNVGVIYNQTLASTGGTAPLSWSVSSGSLPAGLTLNEASGQITGTPTAPGTSSFQIRLVDAANSSSARQLSISVAQGDSAPQIVSSPVTSANIGTPYTYAVTVSGYPESTFSLSSAPAGMTINAGTGVISWTPAAKGTFAVTVNASNGVSPSASQNYSVTVTDYGLHGRPLAGADLGLNINALPATLSATGVFTNVSNLSPAPMLIPYGVNAPLWSDNATKQRWISVPNDGAPYGADETINFAATGEWTFPAGSVLVKHFEINTDERNAAIKRRLETRLLFVRADSSVFGVTYKWRQDGSDADLLPDGADDILTIIDASGNPRTQSWHYPSRNECLQCHTQNAGGVLGVKTRQLNGMFTYASTGVTDNQLRTWNHLNLFSAALNEATIPTYAKLSPLTDSTAPVEQRVRSYVDANCSQCHRPGGSPALFDARFDVPIGSQGLINGTVENDLGISGAKVVTPQDFARSILLHRTDTTAPATRMPPLGRSVIDTQAVAAIKEWIDGLPAGTGLYGTYHDNRDFTGATATRIDPQVSFNWGTNSPIAGIGADTFSVRWTGYVHPQYSQTYTFYTRSDDGARLWVNGQLLIDKWVNQGFTEWSGSIALTAGRKVELVFEYYENGGSAAAQLLWSSPSTPKAIIPQSLLTAVGPPSSPANLLAGAVSSTQINLSWLDTSTGERGYEIERSLDGTAWTPLVSTAANATNYSDTNLQPGTTYHYRVRTVSFTGASAYAGPVSATTNASQPPQPPAAPSSLIAVAASESRIDLNWTDNASDETGFEIERSLDGNGWSLIASPSANTLSHADMGLQEATTYYYVVRAVNGTAKSDFASASATTMSSSGGFPAGGVKINFQPAAAAIPAGYQPDGGVLFGDRGNGLSYGWSVNNSSTARDRNSSSSPDQRYDTLQHMQVIAGAFWELAVPNGDYTVRIVAGDPSNIDSIYKISAEGVLIVNATPTTTQRWVDATGTVSVSDGKLTIANAAGARNNKICFAEITSVAAASRGAVAAAGDVPAPEFVPATAASLSINMSSATRQAVRLRLEIPFADGHADWEGQTIGVDVAGAAKTFVLNARGRSADRDGRCNVRRNPKSGLTVVSIVLAGSFAQEFSDAGMKRKAARTVSVPYSVRAFGQDYGGEAILKMSGHAARMKN